jgi:hypothetical protein
MNRKRLTTIVVCVSMIILLVVGAVWTYLVTSYESDLGTSNTVVVSSSESPVDGSDDNLLLELSFADDAEDLLWSSLEIELEIEGSTHTCSFGVQSKSNQSDSLVSTNLGSDGLTFTAEIDATDEEAFTYFEIGEQIESDASNYWMRFSSTDIFLGENVSWIFLEDASFVEIVENPTSELSNDTESSLDWYTYDLSVHRVDPNEGVYVLQKDDMWFKVSFLTYYNSDDDSRYPTMQVAALNGTDFPALSNPDLVIPSTCMIFTEDLDMDYWNANETITLAENGFNLCSQSCTIKINIEYETTLVEVSKSEIQI